MLNINYIRDNISLVKKAVTDKAFHADIDQLVSLDTQRRQLLKEIEKNRSLRNKFSKLIPTLKDESERNKTIKNVKQINIENADCEKQLKEIVDQHTKIMLLVPNIPLPEVPVGVTEEDNLEIRRWGEPPQFDFPPKDHIEICQSLQLVDFEKTPTFAGSRSHSLMGDGVLLNQAVMQFALDFMVKKSFLPVAPPIMVREEALLGSGFFPIGREDTYHIPEDNVFLAGTSEVSLVSLQSNQILASSELPIRYVGISNCYRREAGSAGRDTKGFYRVHMFNKVEQVSIGINDPDWSQEEHQLLLNNAEEILQALGLPHRVAKACTVELGLGQVLKHEVETWMPSRNSYCETHSCSSLHEFQARRANIRYRDKHGEQLQFVHTLNNTALASPRILIPILEHYQNKDGSVTIPEVLRPYMMNREILEPKSNK